MHRNMIGLVLFSLIAGGCSFEKGSLPTEPAFVDNNPVAPNDSALKPLSLLIGTWTGTETASVGLSGSLSVTFTQSPITNDNTVQANIAWTNGITVHGTVTGTVGNMVITATDGPAGTCSYVAHGTLNVAGTQITGTYNGTGIGAKCLTKAGTFVLNGQSGVLLQCTDSYWTMNQGNDNARENKCKNDGGIWLNDFDVPGDGTSTSKPNVCKFSPNPPGNPGNDETLINPPGLVSVQCNVQHE